MFAKSIHYFAIKINQFLFHCESCENFSLQQRNTLDTETDSVSFEQLNAMQ